MTDLTKATEAADLAVRFDRINEAEKAVECYKAAARYLGAYLDENFVNVPMDVRSQYESKIRQYLNRAATLDGKNESRRMLHQCRYLLQLALDADESGRMEEALEFYTKSVTLALSIKDSDSNVNDIARKALERAEEIKGIHYEKAPSTSVQKSPVAVLPMKANLQRQASEHLKLTSGHQTYTEEEKRVLMFTSNINNNCFLPFMDIDLNEKFKYVLPFEDPNGNLKLAPKQIREFDRWVRPDELCSAENGPKMVVGGTVDCYTIKQTIVSDCSLIASLIVCAQYEKRFKNKKKLITSIIYPRNKNNEPIYNPFGKYMVKLHINGIRRKVIIDELLPYSKYGQLLCSYSSNKNEFWVSLLEKAYMKVMGGYDFPGSNSNTDLHALTGWIPERCAIRRDDPDFDAPALFAEISRQMEAGAMVATVATGPLLPAVEELSGLASAHAYAVLDAQHLHGVRLMKLKNPWSHTRWKGNYSDDSPLWTPELRRELNYHENESNRSERKDDGVFWIDYASIVKFFDVFYMNWSPEQFKMTYCIHQQWDAGVGPAQDSYTVGDNPQFSLRVRGSGQLWLLLTRHITRIEDFRDNHEYITLLVYRGGKRVYYSQDPPPLVDGVRINSPHYLCKLRPDAGAAYTLVVSQYEKTTTIYYTLRAYGTCDFTLNKINDYPYSTTITGEWTSQTAGGCENYPQSFHRNPKYMVTVPDGRTSCAMALELRGPRQYQMGIRLTVDSLDDPTVTAPFVNQDSGSYRSGFVVLELDSLPAGKYVVTVATFRPGEEGAFILKFKATCNVSVAKVSR